ncbi:ATP-binding cassette domain-containing protein, partial [Rhizobium ruizarguesonis]
VEKNIAFGLRQDGMAKDEMTDLVFQMLKLVKLEQFASRKPNQLSGGQRQRVALARSLAKRPKVMLQVHQLELGFLAQLLVERAERFVEQQHLG